MTNSEKDIGYIIQNCKVLLLDIEGTTTSISFVKDKLFPYAAEHVQEFLEECWEQEAVKEAIAALRKLAHDDEEQQLDGVVTMPAEDATKEEQISGIVKNVKWQMSNDRKSGALKLLQGLIWQQGYDKGEIKGHVYEDVPVALRRWRSLPDAGRQVYIYSSGSVAAQRALFQHSVDGDLLPLLDGHFDTAVGAKQEPQSYTNIVQQIGCKAEDVLFLTDILEEATAAVGSGMQAVLVVRHDDQPTPPPSHVLHHITTFHQLMAPHTPGAKRKPDDTEESQPAKVAKIDADDDIKSATEPEESDNIDVSTSKSPKEEDVIGIAEEALQKRIDTVPADIPGEDEMEVSDSKVEESITKDAIPEKTGKSVLTRENDERTEGIPPINKCNTIEEVEDKDVEIEEQSIENKTIIEEYSENTLRGDEPSIIMEIEDVTETIDTDDLEKVDLVPVVEEPTEPKPASTVDMPDDAEMVDILNDEGEALEKECEEILSKVRKVTEIDDITNKVPSTFLATDSMEKPELVVEVTEKSEQDVNDVGNGIPKMTTAGEEIIEQKMDSDLERLVVQTGIDEDSVSISPAEESVDTTSPMETALVDSTVADPTVEKVNGNGPDTLETIVDPPVDTSQEPSLIEEKSCFVENKINDNLNPEDIKKPEVEKCTQALSPTVTELRATEAKKLKCFDKNNVTSKVNDEVTQDEKVDIEETLKADGTPGLSNSNETDQPDIFINGKTNGIETVTAQPTETDSSIETEIVNIVDSMETDTSERTVAGDMMESQIARSTETEPVKAGENVDRTETHKTGEIETTELAETGSGTVTKSDRVTEETNGIEKTNEPTVNANGNGVFVDAKRNGKSAQEPSQLNGIAGDEEDVGSIAVEGSGKVKAVVVEPAAAMEREG